MLPRVSRFMQCATRIVVAKCDTVDTHEGRVRLNGLPDITLKFIPCYNEAELNIKFKMFPFLL